MGRTLIRNRATSAARQVTLHGREFLVAPITLIIPGILPGSKGSLLYPIEEVNKNPSAWNDIPITAYHPTDPVTGEHVSASDPGVLERQGIGFLRNATANGKLRAEGYFDILKTMEINSDIIRRLKAGIPTEVSTGLFTENDPAPPGATFQGRTYTAVARDYEPDHLAILPTQVGACSLNDGCGVFNKHLACNCHGRRMNFVANTFLTDFPPAEKLERTMSKLGFTGNSGTSEGAKKAWDTRGRGRKAQDKKPGAYTHGPTRKSPLASVSESSMAHEASSRANKLSKTAEQNGGSFFHDTASESHRNAASAHTKAAVEAAGTGNDKAFQEHVDAIVRHGQQAAYHQDKAGSGSKDDTVKLAKQAAIEHVLGQVAERNPEAANHPAVKSAIGRALDAVHDASKATWEGTKQGAKEGVSGAHIAGGLLGGALGVGLGAAYSTTGIGRFFNIASGDPIGVGAVKTGGEMGYAAGDHTLGHLFSPVGAAVGAVAGAAHGLGKHLYKKLTGNRLTTNQICRLIDNETKACKLYKALGKLGYNAKTPEEEHPVAKTLTANLWSDAAREAAIEARRAHMTGKDPEEAAHKVLHGAAVDHVMGHITKLHPGAVDSSSIREAVHSAVGAGMKAIRAVGGAIRGASGAIGDTARETWEGAKSGSHLGGAVGGAVGHGLGAATGAVAGQSTTIAKDLTGLHPSFEEAGEGTHKGGVVGKVLGSGIGSAVGAGVGATVGAVKSLAKHLGRAITSAHAHSKARYAGNPTFELGPTSPNAINEMVEAITNCGLAFEAVTNSNLTDEYKAVVFNQLLVANAYDDDDDDEEDDEDYEDDNDEVSEDDGEEECDNCAAQNVDSPTAPPSQKQTKSRPAAAIGSAESEQRKERPIGNAWSDAARAASAAARKATGMTLSHGGSHESELSIKKMQAISDDQAGPTDHSMISKDHLSAANYYDEQNQPALSTAHVLASRAQAKAARLKRVSLAQQASAKELSRSAKEKSSLAESIASQGAGPDTMLKAVKAHKTAAKAHDQASAAYGSIGMQDEAAIHKTAADSHRLRSGVSNDKVCNCENMIKNSKGVCLNCGGMVLNPGKNVQLGGEGHGWSQEEKKRIQAGLQLEKNAAVKNLWTDEAREAALEVRRANAKGPGASGDAPAQDKNSLNPMRLVKGLASAIKGGGRHAWAALKGGVKGALDQWSGEHADDADVVEEGPEGTTSGYRAGRRDLAGWVKRVTTPIRVPAGALWGAVKGGVTGNKKYVWNKGCPHHAALNATSKAETAEGHKHAAKMHRKAALLTKDKELADAHEVIAQVHDEESRKVSNAMTSKPHKQVFEPAEAELHEEDAPAELVGPDNLPPSPDEVDFRDDGRQMADIIRDALGQEKNIMADEQEEDDHQSPQSSPANLQADKAARRTQPVRTNNQLRDSIARILKHSATFNTWVDASREAIVQGKKALGKAKKTLYRSNDFSHAMSHENTKQATAKAERLSDRATVRNSSNVHEKASEAHEEAARNHAKLVDILLSLGNRKAAAEHSVASRFHLVAFNEHKKVAENLVQASKTNGTAATLSKIRTANVAVTKKEKDGNHPSSHYAFVSDPSQPSTWKLRIDDKAHVGGAVAALSGSGYRGQKVSIPKDVRTKVLGKVASAWHKFNRDREDIPPVIANALIENCGGPGGTKGRCPQGVNHNVIRTGQRAHKYSKKVKGAMFKGMANLEAKSEHTRSAKLHNDAADVAEKKGLTKAAAFHRHMAQMHSAKADEHMAAVKNWHGGGPAVDSPAANIWTEEAREVAIEAKTEKVNNTSQEAFVLTNTAMASDSWENHREASTAHFRAAHAFRQSGQSDPTLLANAENHEAMARSHSNRANWLAKQEGIKLEAAEVS